MDTNKALEGEVSKGEKYAALSCTDPALPSLGCCGMRFLPWLGTELGSPQAQKESSQVLDDEASLSRAARTALVVLPPRPGEATSGALCSVLGSPVPGRQGTQ